jgi:hypothetical protein
LTSTRIAHPVLPAEREPGRLVRRDRAAVEPGQEQRGVVDGHLAYLSYSRAGTDRQRALLDERLGQRADADDPLPGDELREVDDVRADVAERAGPSFGRPQPPHQRVLRVDDPVL